MLIPLIVAILQLPSTGNPTEVEAKSIAAPIAACAERLAHPEIDAPLLVAVVWRESGFRVDAIRKKNGKPRMLGLAQLNERFLDPAVDWRDPDENVREFCKKLRRVAREHRKRCAPGDHHVVLHHFSGFAVTPRARRVVKEVLRRRAIVIEKMAPR